MKNRVVSIILLFFTLTIENVVVAYEVDTHARVAQSAVDRSDLGKNTDLLKRLGLHFGMDLGDIYFDYKRDTIQDTIYERKKSKNYINKIFPKSKGDADDDINFKNPRAWIMRGAVREDDLPKLFVPFPSFAIPFFVLQPTPVDDPFGSFIRVRNHFYDPFFKRALNIADQPPLGETERAVDWATGYFDSFGWSGSPLPSSITRNHFNVRTARESFYRAFTGLTNEGTPIGPATDGEKTLTELSQLRRAYLASAFRSLGNVIHLVQDMGQPQHTRNDFHTPLHSKSRKMYETYINDRAKLTINFSGSTEEVEKLTPLVYSGYSVVPSFARYTDFFSTSRTATSENLNELKEGKGLADFSNREFFSEGTNLGSNDYKSPPNDVSVYKPEKTTIETKLGIKDHFLLKRDVKDNVGLPQPLVALTTVSAWSDALTELSFDPEYSLTKNNYDAQANILVPASVAYSAGLLNYFFRGRLQLRGPDEHIFSIIDHATRHTAGFGPDRKPINSETGEVFGFSKFKIKVRNATPSIVPPGSTAAAAVAQNMTDGFLQAVVKYNVNFCYKPDLTGQFPPEAFPDDGSTVQIDPLKTWSNCSMTKYLTGEEGIPSNIKLDDWTDQHELVSVSKRIPVGAGGEVNEVPKDDFHLFTFDFKDDPIPINARNVQLQIIYRGKLGSGDTVEEDAIAVRTAQIPEPTFLTITNNLDYVKFNGTFMTPEAVLEKLSTITDDVTGEVLNIKIPVRPAQPIRNYKCKDGNDIPDLIKVDAIPVKSYIRVAVLPALQENTPLGPCSYNVVNQKGEVETIPFVTWADNNLDFLDRDNDTFFFSTYTKFRGIVQKQGRKSFYEKSPGRWGALFQSLGTHLLPTASPEEDVDLISDELNPRPVPVIIRCEYTAEGCSG